MRRDLERTLIAAGATLLWLTLALPAAGQSAPLVEAGRDEFLRYCAACHGSAATGGGPVTPVLRTAPPDLTGLARRHEGVFPTADVAAIIDGRFGIEAHGTRTMPVWGRVLGKEIADGTTADEVSRGRIDALVSYLQSIQH